MNNSLTKQDTKPFDLKFKEALKDTDFRRKIRNEMNLKKIKCPKNKSKNTEIKIIQTTFNDSHFMNKEEIISLFLKPIFSTIKENIDKNGFNHSFEISEGFLKRTDYKIDLNEFEMYKINDFVFYCSIVQCKKESMHYEFEDVDLSRDISKEEIERVKKEAVFKEELINVYDIRFIFPVKSLSERKLKL